MRPHRARQPPRPRPQLRPCHMPNGLQVATLPDLRDRDLTILFAHRRWLPLGIAGEQDTLREVHRHAAEPLGHAVHACGFVDAWVW